MGICVSCRRRELQPPDKRAGGAGGGRVPGKGAAAELLPRRAAPDMANSISNIKMTNPIKGIVSKRRKRYIKDGFNLDLAYITDKLIAMGFPAEKLEGVYRNHIDEVFRFLEQMHMDHYKIYNLCSEKCYDSSKFHGRVARYAFEDHTPPNMELIQPFCEDVHLWLSADSRNVAAVHCKAGKGRTGTMVCCYLLFSGFKTNADEALKYYGKKRTHDEKGVTIPSQRRYVEYYGALVRSGLKYTATRVHIRELVMSPPPALNGGQGSIEITVSQASPPLKTPSGSRDVRKHDRHIRIVLDQCTPLQGDVRVDVYNKPKMMMRKEKLFHFWFNTFFVANGIGAVRVSPPQDSLNLDTFKLTLNKWQLDDAHKDKQHKQYSPDFKVEVIVQKQPESARYQGGGGGGGGGGGPAGGRVLSPPSPPSPPSSASSSSEPDPDSDAHWDSGETPYSALSAATHTWDSTPEVHNWTSPDKPPISWTGPEIPPNWAPELPPKSWTNSDNLQQNWPTHMPLQNWGNTPESPQAWIADNPQFFDKNKEENCPHGYKFFSPAYSSQDACKHRCMRLETECQFDNNTSCSYLNDVEMKPCSNCIEMDFSNDNDKNSSPIKTMENAGLIKDGYLLIDRSPRHQKDIISDPNKTDDIKSKAESSTRKCRHVGISKDGYMLVDATPRQPPVKDSKGKAGASSSEVLGLSAVANMTNMRLNSERPEDDYMEFSATDGYMKAVEHDTKARPSFSEEYAYMNELSDDKTGLCEASVGNIVPGDKSAEASAATDSKASKNKKHSFFKRDEYKNDKGKIPKVSSDHTISDESKKKYNFFQRRDEDGSKPRINFGDMRASWKEFSGKWSENRKKKDRDES